jgi:hypothetical protein
MKHSQISEKLNLQPIGDWADLRACFAVPATRIGTPETQASEVVDY